MLNTKPANAQSVNLRTYPSLIQIKAQTPSDLSTNITIENLTDASVNVDTQLRMFKAGDKGTGELDFLSPIENPNGILQKIHLIEGENEITGLTLGPNQKKRLSVKIDLKDTAELRDYYFSVIFLSRPINYQAQDPQTDSQNSFSIINAGVATNFLISIGGPIESAGTIEEFSAPQYSQSGPIAFKIKMQNNTSKYISPSGTIYIKNMFGQTVGKVDILPKNILANSSRYLTSPNSKPENLSSLISHLSSPKAIWPEKFLLGFYEAQLNMQTSDSGQTATRTIRFFVFPTKFSIIFALCLILFLLIYRRVKQKLSQ
jgi:hypothetical protein